MIFIGNLFLFFKNYMSDLIIFQLFNQNISLKFQNFPKKIVFFI